jgi:hypothetical protein
MPELNLPFVCSTQTLNTLRLVTRLKYFAAHISQGRKAFNCLSVNEAPLLIRTSPKQLQTVPHRISHKPSTDQPSSRVDGAREPSSGELSDQYGCISALLSRPYIPGTQVYSWLTPRPPFTSQACV